MSAAGRNLTGSETNSATVSMQSERRTIRTLTPQLVVIHCADQH